jgi:hypothetical protein
MRLTLGSSVASPWRQAHTVGAFIGVILSGLAHVRREPFVGLRMLTFVGNIAVLGFGLWALFLFS